MATFNLLPPEIQSSEDSDLGDEQMKSVVEESDPGSTSWGMGKFCNE